jgi:sodium transport system permease protein
LFGLLHGSLYRLLPTFIIGLLPGYVVWRSGSSYCSILIYLLNNGRIATLIWSSKGKEMAMRSVPWSLTLGALALTIIGLALITGPTAKSNPAGQLPSLPGQAQHDATVTCSRYGI